jgi:hypothetical protein
MKSLILNKILLLSKIIRYFFSHALLVVIFFSISSIFFYCSDDPVGSTPDDRNLKTVIPEDVGYSSTKLEEVKTSHIYF